MGEDIFGRGFDDYYDVFVVGVFVFQFDQVVEMLIGGFKKVVLIGGEFCIFSVGFQNDGYQNYQKNIGFGEIYDQFGLLFG